MKFLGLDRTEWSMVSFGALVLMTVPVLSLGVVLLPGAGPTVTAYLDPGGRVLALHQPAGEPLVRLSDDRLTVQNISDGPVSLRVRNHGGDGLLYLGGRWVPDVLRLEPGETRAARSFPAAVLRIPALVLAAVAVGAAGISAWVGRRPPPHPRRRHRHRNVPWEGKVGDPHDITGGLAPLGDVPGLGGPATGRGTTGADDWVASLQAADTDPTRLSEPVTGWKMLMLVPPGGDDRSWCRIRAGLHSPMYQSVVWGTPEAGRVPAVLAGPGCPHHQDPDPRGVAMCGIHVAARLRSAATWARDSIDVLTAPWGGGWSTVAPEVAWLVPTQVHAWGTCVEHELGWRAARARAVALVVPGPGSVRRLARRAGRWARPDPCLPRMVAATVETGRACGLPVLRSDHPDVITAWEVSLQMVHQIMSEPDPGYLF